jgi:hypothetical protein
MTEYHRKTQANAAKKAMMDAMQKDKAAGEELIRGLHCPYCFI